MVCLLNLAAANLSDDNINKKKRLVQEDKVLILHTGTNLAMAGFGMLMLMSIAPFPGTVWVLLLKW